MATHIQICTCDTHMCTHTHTTGRMSHGERPRPLSRTPSGASFSSFPPCPFLSRNPKQCVWEAITGCRSINRTAAGSRVSFSAGAGELTRVGHSGVRGRMQAFSIQGPQGPTSKLGLQAKGGEEGGLNPRHQHLLAFPRSVSWAWIPARTPDPGQVSSEDRSKAPDSAETDTYSHHGGSPTGLR